MIFCKIISMPYLGMHLLKLQFSIQTIWVFPSFSGVLLLENMLLSLKTNNQKKKTGNTTSTSLTLTNMRSMPSQVRLYLTWHLASVELIICIMSCPGWAPLAWSVDRKPPQHDGEIVGNFAKMFVAANWQSSHGLFQCGSFPFWYKQLQALSPCIWENLFATQILLDKYHHEAILIHHISLCSWLERWWRTCTRCLGQTTQRY